MNVDALFDKLAVDLAPDGVRESADGDARTLVFDGTPFARLLGERMAFRLPPGTPGLGDALALESSTPAGDGRWVEVDSDDVSEWERLAEQALSDLR